MKSRYVLFGLLFGFVLSRAGATDYDAIAGMFRLTDFHLYGVIGAAVAVSAIGFLLFRRGILRTRTHEPPALERKPVTRGLVSGGLLFGVGWAVAGTCPGTAVAQIGEGHLAGVFTFGGILIGAYLQRRLGAAGRLRAAARSDPAGAPRIAPAAPAALPAVAATPDS